MQISEIITLLDAKILTSSSLSDEDIAFAFSADMMSDVLAYANRHMLLITGLTNPQAVRTAEMLDISCILYVRGKIPAQSILDLAEELNIVILTTELTMFETCGILYGAGMHGGKIDVQKQ